MQFEANAINNTPYISKKIKIIITLVRYLITTTTTKYITQQSLKK